MELNRNYCSLLNDLFLIESKIFHEKVFKLLHGVCMSFYEVIKSLHLPNLEEDLSC